MSVAFGRWNLDGRPVDPGYLQKAKDMFAPHGPDGERVYIKDSVGILYWAFHTTKESRKESQPFVTRSGTVICWDGRLDNRSELVGYLVLTVAATDVEIVAAAWESWGTDCFAKLIGDWALAIWNPTSRSLFLAKDFVGTRHLYYLTENDQVTWSSTLEPLVLLSGKSWALEEEYIAGWLSFFPATHLTPYMGIRAVPPSSFVRVEEGRQTICKYWDFDPSKRIRYRADGEYEEHFRQVFETAVRRRLRSDSPALAELSGGIDSSSIVCMADSIITQGKAETRRLDTVSYYDDTEPNWNERPYFTRVEEKRGRTGTHIDVSQQQFFFFDFEADRLMAMPGSGLHTKGVNRLLASTMVAQGNRVVLSGIGGDEVMGGVPTPTPELEDLLARGRFRTLAHQVKAWALNKRQPWIHMVLEAASGFFPASTLCIPKQRRPARWLADRFVKRNSAALLGYQRRLRLFGPLPSFQEHLSTLEALRRQLACCSLPLDPPHEKAYPYLDRNLLEFMFAVPREQLVRPGQRRSLMRRALAGIVPDELLYRKRKAFVARAPIKTIGTRSTELIESAQRMLASELGIVDSTRFTAALRRVREEQEVVPVRLLRTLIIENWLRNLQAFSLLPGLKSGSGVPQQLLPLTREKREKCWSSSSARGLGPFSKADRKRRR